MKTQIATLALATGSTLANFAQMAKDFKEGADALASLRSASGESKAITANDMALVNEYGCWCYFQNDHSKAKGQPTDGIDQICKVLHDGYKCAMMDAADMGDNTCVPWEINYDSATGAGLAINMDINTIRTECDTQNPVIGCANWACKIEGYFVQSLLFYFVQGGLLDSTKNHSNGFDPVSMCPTQTGIASERECCDEHPIRFPFKTYGNDRQCCVDRTYDATVYQCCNDGSLAIGVCSP